MARDRKGAPRKVLGSAEEVFASPLLLELHAPDLTVLRQHLPKILTDAENAKLFAAIWQACLWLAREKDHERKGVANADLMRQPGKGQLAPLERLAKHLEAAVEAWKEVHGDGDWLFSEATLAELGLKKSPGQELEAMALDARAQVDELRALGEPKRIASTAFPEFVRDVAHCLRQVGLHPTASSDIYSGGAGIDRKSVV